MRDKAPLHNEATLGTSCPLCCMPWSPHPSWLEVSSQGTRSRPRQLRISSSSPTAMAGPHHAALSEVEWLGTGAVGAKLRISSNDGPSSSRGISASNMRWSRASTVLYPARGQREVTVSTYPCSPAGLKAAPHV